MDQSRPLFVYFRHFLITILIIEKSIDGVLGIRTQGRRMVGADETTELWRPPDKCILTHPVNIFRVYFYLIMNANFVMLQPTQNPIIFHCLKAVSQQKKIFQSKHLGIVGRSCGTVGREARRPTSENSHVQFSLNIQALTVQC